VGGTTVIVRGAAEEVYQQRHGGGYFDIADSVV